MDRVVQSVQRLSYGLDGPGIKYRWGSRFSAPLQAGPRAHPASYTMGTGSFPGVKRPERGVDHPPSSSAEVKERVVIPLLPLWAFVACSRVNFTFTFTQVWWTDTISSDSKCVSLPRKASKRTLYNADFLTRVLAITPFQRPVWRTFKVYPRGFISYFCYDILYNARSHKNTTTDL